MKNLFFASTIFAAAFMVLTTQANAQLVVSGSFGLEQESNKIDNHESRTTNFEIKPSAGYVFGDLEIGLGLGYSVILASSGSESSTVDESTISVEPYIHYDFAKAGKFIFGLEATSLLGFGDNEERTYSIEVLPVVTFEINDRWDFDIFASVFEIGYTKYTEGDASTSKFRFFGNNGQLVSMGFTYKF